jgi:hypothetical protein
MRVNRIFFWGIFFIQVSFFGNFSWADISASPQKLTADQETYLLAVKSTHQNNLKPAKLEVLKEGELAEMLTWTTHDYAMGSQVLTHAVWVVEASQMKAHCQAIFASGENPSERINQLLGMPPDSSDSRHFELIRVPVTPYVFVKDQLQGEIIRPCFSSGNVSQSSCHYSAKTVSPYQHWLESIKTETANYPWTGLGYTYDWSPNNPSHIGLSEFILPIGAQVWVEKSLAPKMLCSKKS